MEQKHIGQTVCQWIWVCGICLLLLMPAVLFCIFGEGEPSSGTMHAAKPVLSGESGLNRNFLKEWGEYFSERFTLRESLVSVNSLVWTKVFNSSPDKSVIAGKNGWLFYESTMDDYLNRETLSDREIDDIIYNLELLQEQLNKRDVPFVFIMAPNKNSLYPQYMPDGYVQEEASGNADKLLAALEKSNVGYISLHELFRGQKKVLYHKEDSHWNNEGAAMVAEALLDRLGQEHASYREMPCQVKDDFTGDLYSMLFPAMEGADREIYYEQMKPFDYVHPVRNNYEATIETESAGEQNACVVFRDSFGNALLPFLAGEFARGYFSRAVPMPAYQCEELQKKLDTGGCVCIMEIVERHLQLLKENAPVLAAEGEPVAEEELGHAVLLGSKEDYRVTEEKQSGLIKLHGVVQPADGADREQGSGASRHTVQEPSGSAEKALYLCMVKKGQDAVKYPVYRTSEGDSISGNSTAFTVYLEPEEWDEQAELRLYSLTE